MIVNSTVGWIKKSENLKIYKGILINRILNKMCKCFYLFLIFAFVQIQLRWQRDDQYQWMLSLKGSSTTPIEFTHKFTVGHPPLKIFSSHIEFFVPHQIFVYSNGTVKIDDEDISIRAFVKKGSILKVYANKSIYLDIISGIPKDLHYLPLYK